MKINKMTTEELKAALRKAAEHGDKDSVYVRHIRRRLEVLK